MNKFSYGIIGMLLSACAQDSNTGFNDAISLGESTPPNSCSDLQDCSFFRNGVHYISFDGIVTKREICTPSAFPYGIEGDDSSEVAFRKALDVFGMPRSESDSRTNLSFTATVRGDDVTVDIQAAPSGRVACVSEMISAL